MRLTRASSWSFTAVLQCGSICSLCLNRQLRATMGLSSASRFGFPSAGKHDQGLVLNGFLVVLNQRFSELLKPQAKLCLEVGGHGQGNNVCSGGDVRGER